MKPKFLNNLQIQVALVFLLVSLVPLGTVSIFSVRTANRVIEDIVQNQLENVAAEKQVVTLSDSGGTIFDKNGINEEKLAWVKGLKNVRRGRIREYAEHFEGAEYYPDQKPCSLRMLREDQPFLAPQSPWRRKLPNGCWHRYRKHRGSRVN